MKKLFLFLLLTFGAANLTTAQETALSVSFYNRYDGTESSIPMSSQITGFEGWNFTNCYAFNSSYNFYLQVGSSTKSGSFTTPALGLNGNATLLIKTRRISGAATFEVTVSGGGSVEGSNSFSVESGSESRPSAILLKNCTPSSKISIVGKDVYFEVLSMKVFSIYDAIFYESFDYMAGDQNIDFSYSKTLATAANCDYTGSTFSENGVRQAHQSIFFLSGNSFSYQTPTISNATEGTYLLTFRIAELKTGNDAPSFTISCNGSTKLSPLNSIDLTDLAPERSMTFYTDDYTPNIWLYYHVAVQGITSSTKITFTGKALFLDDVQLTPMPTGLNHSTDNSLFMRIYDGQTMDVQLTRTLTPNIWCPLCLPFDVTPELMAREVGSCQVCTLSGISGGVFSFSDVAEGTIIDAGTPFLVKVATQVVNPVFHNVTISNTAAKTVTFDGADGYKFVGTYSPVTLNTDGTHLFLGTDGMLYKPGTEDGYNRLGGLRAYFEIPSSPASSTRVDINDNSNAIITLSAETVTSTGTFDLQGRRMPQGPLRQGLYISNGRKVLVR